MSVEVVVNKSAVWIGRKLNVSVITVDHPRMDGLSGMIRVSGRSRRFERAYSQMLTIILLVSPLRQTDFAVLTPQA